LALRPVGAGFGRLVGAGSDGTVLGADPEEPPDEPPAEPPVEPLAGAAVAMLDELPVEPVLELPEPVPEPIDDVPELAEPLVAARARVTPVVVVEPPWPANGSRPWPFRPPRLFSLASFTETLFAFELLAPAPGTGVVGVPLADFVSSTGTATRPSSSATATGQRRRSRSSVTMPFRMFIGSPG
jgi:hypothetical protein